MAGEGREREGRGEERGRVKSGRGGEGRRRERGGERQGEEWQWRGGKEKGEGRRETG